ncbi:hypothetical protein NQ314_014340 [Rhamnusium bicolor]|uniref:ATP-dependent RNA helicase n=1 Tax=Rhamnusium bicolor TaxID=1586634 RepID=A0AAV8X2N7_9CUCU|nr:hypothetical protein NQ314_014340 [Rhamnusium bicolor]
MAKKADIWKPIEIENIFTGGVEGLIGIEECTEYDLNIVSKKKTKNKLPRYKESPIKRKKKKIDEMSKSKSKITLLANDLFSPSKCGNTTEIEEISSDMKLKQDTLNLEVWSSFGLPNSILKAIEKLEFTQPTQIQSLTLPAAILGRRDILGAAETGSGKTLAFGLPILAGILKIKEQSTNKRISDELMNNSDSEESDFEKAENEIHENEMGCIKSINNVEFKQKVVSKPLYALILTPTRELAMQIKTHLDAVSSQIYR